MSEEQDHQSAPGEAAQPAPAEASPPDQPEAPPVEALQAEIAELKDKLLRTYAESENYRRRAEREREDAAKYAVASFARGLTDVADNLRRAIEAVPAEAREADEAVRNLLEGVELTERSLLSAFEKSGIRPIAPALGEKADPNRHEVLFEVPGTGQPAGSIIQVVQTGYTIHDRLLRAAKVGVAKSETEAPPAVDTRI